MELPPVPQPPDCPRGLEGAVAGGGSQLAAPPPAACASGPGVFGVQVPQGLGSLPAGASQRPVPAGALGTLREGSRCSAPPRVPAPRGPPSPSVLGKGQAGGSGLGGPSRLRLRLFFLSVNIPRVPDGWAPRQQTPAPGGRSVCLLHGDPGVLRLVPAALLMSTRARAPGFLRGGLLPVHRGRFGCAPRRVCLVTSHAPIVTVTVLDPTPTPARYFRVGHTHRASPRKSSVCVRSRQPSSHPTQLTEMLKRFPSPVPHLNFSLQMFCSRCRSNTTRHLIGRPRSLFPGLGRGADPAVPGPAGSQSQNGGDTRERSSRMAGGSVSAPSRDRGRQLCDPRASRCRRGGEAGALPGSESDR